MRFLADMGVSMGTVAWLRERGHEVVHLREQGLQRTQDCDILDKARIEGRVVLTFDLDFGDLLALGLFSDPSVPRPASAPRTWGTPGHRPATPGAGAEPTTPFALAATLSTMQKISTLPKQRDLVAQIHSIKRRVLPSGKVSFDAERTGRGGHADRFWAIALACQKERGAGRAGGTTEIGVRVVGEGCLARTFERQRRLPARAGLGIFGRATSPAHGAGLGSWSGPCLNPPPHPGFDRRSGHICGVVFTESVLNVAQLRLRPIRFDSLHLHPPHRSRSSDAVED